MLFSGLSISHEKTNHESSSTEWFLQVLQACVDGAWLWENPKQTEKMYISKRMKERLGYSETSNIGETRSWWFDHFHPDDLQKIKEFRHDCLSNPEKTGGEIEFRVRHCHGHYLWLLMNCHLERDKAKNLVRAAGSFTDISYYRLIHSQLEKTIQDAELISQGKSKFIATLNHELRTPLSGILGMVSLLKETSLTQEQLHRIDNIQQSADMMLALVNDILDVSKIAAGKLELEEQKFSLKDSIQRIVELITPVAAKKKLPINLLLEQNLPDVVLGDCNRFQQILINILNNAIKFTESGFVRLSVIIKAWQENKIIIRFEIADTGIGISPENLKKLFQDFTQGHASISSSFGGTGLGLAICKKLVTLMGGDVGVTSTLGQGSLFWFEIPFENAQTDIMIKPKSQPKVEIPVAQPNLHPLKILLVEDNKINQEVMIGLINRLGDTVVVANNGLESLEKFESQEFDIVLMDINMPVMDGLTATRKIREMSGGKEIPIIAVTANTIISDKNNCMENGMTDVVNKPVNKDLLSTILFPYRHNNGDAQNMNFEILNQEAVSGLINDLGQETVFRLLDIYKQDAKDILDQMKSCNQLKEQQNLAHTLAGMSENLGIQEIGKTAREIMGMCDQSSSKMPVLIQTLEKQFVSAIDEISYLTSV